MYVAAQSNKCSSQGQIPDPALNIVMHNMKRQIKYFLNNS